MNHENRFTTVGNATAAASVTGPGEAGRLPASAPQVLPSDCATSVGNNDGAKLTYLIDCSNGPDTDTGPTDCDWWSTPAQPGRAAAPDAARNRSAAAGSAGTEALWQRVAALIP